MDSRVVSLAKKILLHATEYDNTATQAGNPSPTLDFDSFPESRLPPEAQSARDSALEACAELQAILRGPVAVVRNAIEQHINIIYLQILYRSQVASHIPADGSSISYEELAAKSSLHPSLLRRIVRYAITCNIFREPQPGLVCHNGASRALAQTPELEAWVGMHAEELWPAATRTTDAIQKWSDSGEPNSAGYQLAHGTDEHFFNFLTKNPARLERFAKAMSIQKRPAAIYALVESYSWADLGANAVIVDVGGSHGTAAIALASAFPNLTCVVQDLPGVVSKAPAAPPSVSDRVTFEAHDFFTEQPVEGAAVYFFRYIFHDWPDKYCIRILRALIPAMRSGSRVIVNEFCLPDPGTWPAERERSLRLFDLNMLCLQNSKERDAGEWKTLFHEADPRFRLVNVNSLPGSSSLIEVEWEGNEES